MSPEFLTQRLGLGLTQQEVDFVDINLKGDLPLFLDPFFLGQRSDTWSYEASRTVRSFFQHFINLIRTGDEDEAYALFAHLGEPNETGLGLSKGRSQGRGVGKDDSFRIFMSLKQSRAVQSGLVEHLEDCRLFINGIDRDKTSDMTTNIIRRHLIEYTQMQCANHGIELSQAPSGFMWSMEDKAWTSGFTPMLMVDGRVLLLVPKAIVSYSNSYASSKYHQHFILNFLKHEHLRLGTALVETRRLKSGVVKRFVTKKRLRKEVAPEDKNFITEFTAGHPDVFADFRSDAAGKMESLPHEEFARIATAEVATHLIAALQSIPLGTSGATQYEKTIAAILALLLYPDLVTPEMQVKIHNGRKRIDIVYCNAADQGFFRWLHEVAKIFCPFMYVECKNYSSDPANPELDQLSGRFSTNRGRAGLLVSRSIENLPLFLSRCSDTLTDDRGLIIPIADADLLSLLQNLKGGLPSGLQELLRERYAAIALR